ncbi:unnamed protein product [Phytophthora fragariaefolia]|uniref:Unnamed protein product n=1 Tax=Phytophthora fragariaefolia TaxID=1490495 RepID=A0A9W6Y626_9STRA|nr:unnamed protein product [Phytophthora fragariaefolia]
MPTTLRANYEPPDSSELPLSTSMQGPFSEASTNGAKLDESLLLLFKEEGKQGWTDNGGIDVSMCLRGATVPNMNSNNHADNQSTTYPSILKDTAEAKRARRSAIEKKSRQRRQHILKRMREEVKYLENVYADVAAKKEARGLVQWSGLRSLSGIASMRELHQKYSELTLVAHALEEDQAALQRLLQEHEYFHKTVRRMSDERQAEDAFAIWDSGVPPCSSFRAKFRPLSMAEGYAFVRDSYAEIQKFTESENYKTTGASLMGWTDKRKYDPNCNQLQYGFTKQFPFENVERVFAETWDACLNGLKLEKLVFDCSSQSRFEVLQILNDNLVVVRRDYRLPMYSITFTSIQIIFRLQTPAGYILCLRTIGSPEIEAALESHERMFNVFHWYVLCGFVATAVQYH